MAFYSQLDETTFGSSAWTAGPWGPESQHAGPPSALLTRAIEQFEPREGHRLGRVSVDILGAVPIAPVQISIERLRSGRRLELFEAKAETNDRTVLIARAWRLACTPDTYPSTSQRDPLDPQQLPAAEPTVWTGMHLDGYVAAIDFRFERSAFEEFGPGMAWGRQRVPLVEGEEPTAWQRAMVLADSGSGISLALDPSQHPAINCDLSVALHRDPVSEWIGLDSVSTISAGSGALTTTTMLDLEGSIGVASQVLLAG